MSYFLLVPFQAVRTGIGDFLLQSLGGFFDQRLDGLGSIARDEDGV